MTAAMPFSSRHDLKTVCSTVPITYSSSYGSDEGYANSLYSQSLNSNTEILGSPSSTHDSFAFINGGYYSPYGSRRSQMRPNMEMWEESEEDDEANEIDKMAYETDKVGTDALASESTPAKNVKNMDNMLKLSVPLFMRPQSRIRLIRAKSPSTELILDPSLPGERNTTAVDSGGSKSMYLSTREVSKKRGGYLRKIGALFKVSSSKSLNSLASKSIDDLTSFYATTLNVPGLIKSRSHSYISDKTTGNTSGKVLVLGSIQCISEIDREAETSDKHMIRSKSEVKIVMENAIEAERCEISSDSTENQLQMSRHLTTYKPERHYSLIRRENEENDSSYVNFTRIPSLRKRKVHLRLHHHFTMIHPPEENEDSHVIKEATHIQPLVSGEAVVTDILANNMVLFDTDGNAKITFSFESGSEPWATCLTSDGCLAVTLKRQGCVSLWSSSGEPVSEFGQNVLSAPTGIQCDQHGRFVVADEQANSVFVFSRQGELLTKLQAPKVEADTPPTPRRSRPSSPCFPQSFFNQPRYVCITNSGNYVISDSANHCIKIFDEEMNFLRQFGCYGRGDGNFKFPYGVASDANNNLYVADYFNNRVSMFSPEGEFIEHLLTSQDDIARPKSIAVTQSFLYVTHGSLRSSKVSVYTLQK